MRHKPDVLFVIEPIMQIQKQYYLRMLNFHSDHVNIFNKIWVFTTQRVKLDNIMKEDQILIGKLDHPTLDFSPQVNFVYAKNSYVKRRDLWEQIKDHYTDQVRRMVVGDFYCILEANERACSFRHGSGPC